ncbi:MULTISPECIES: alpha/beta fold hydrolase [Halocynthiibacter]|uniref:Alpha/beta fold hydrolase n=1 Tax=Halocynthiibacter halioticoli TaxID=2986804 RepID=A0AAE3LUQ0_9RHOB|nr:MULTISPECIES: alpha/beta fold hydrolase [Halocynthiibacter]MCV6825210.1 alpha/beta fold hydrolase [Halocynthiibacter halioticoli]MCW4058211.1 alpha/beta fold hydrolase [Halocynthiibacter sp. SDUM655004]
MLRVVSQGSQTNLPSLLIVHGLFGSARNWNVVAKRMSATRMVYTVDMRNHGESPRAETQSYADMADDLAEVLESIQGNVDVIGHSMGGKAAMVLALQQPDLVNRLLVADIAPVGYSHTQTPLVHAMKSLDLSAIERRSEADGQLASQIEDAGVRAFLLQSLDVKEKRWRLNLDVLEAEMEKIVGFPDVTGQYDKPTLFLSGANSDYVQPEHRPKIKSLFPNAKFAKIPGAAHWLHAEKPREFEAALQAFFN